MPAFFVLGAFSQLKLSLRLPIGNQGDLHECLSSYTQEIA